jgi:hypothetical protein
MDLFRLIRGLTGRRFVTPPPWESSYTLFLKLVRRHKAGGLVISHYLADPDERPDHVFRHDSRQLSFTQGDFVTTRWTVIEITKEEEALLERVPGKHRSEHFVVLSDDAGNVILQDYYTAEKAERAMAIVERTTSRRVW